MKVSVEFPVKFVRELGTRIMLAQRNGVMPAGGFRCGARTDAGLAELEKTLQQVADAIIKRAGEPS